MFVYLLILVSMGLSMLVAGRQDFADGNSRDGRFLISLGVLSLLAAAVLGIVPF